mmetsp:Transcript_16836/g.23064  ORF Transcript_16836/g.23064 Transcript_16836/m.23064 type:complete len:103 (+) Transcript_16836:89-397(+)
MHFIDISNATKRQKSKGHNFPVIFVCGDDWKRRRKSHETRKICQNRDISALPHTWFLIFINTKIAFRELLKFGCALGGGDIFFKWFESVLWRHSAHPLKADN